ncbi:MAG: hypothetical protein CHACPFDD_00077 [Phycisphaerae bacterium]|nr:hypothetical protein [Phycisphaerae bacterium]
MLLSVRAIRPAYWILLVLVFSAVLATTSDQFITHWTYAAERGRIQANADELASLQDVSRAFRAVAKVARPAVVHIRVEGGTPDETRAGELEEALRRRFGDQLDAQELREFARERSVEPPASGSGALIDPDGYVLTNNHVVRNRTTIEVHLSDERVYPARLVGSDFKTDLAVIKIDAPDLHVLKFGDSDAMEVGDWVIAVGAPFGLAQSVTHGIISAKGRTSIPGVDIMYQDFIQTDAAINPGNSGGPLLNLKGEIIGVNTAIATNGDSYSAGIAFTIPSKMARHIASELIRKGEVQRGWLGVQMSNLPRADLTRLGVDRDSGVALAMIYEETPAARGGLEVDDVLLAVNGTAITNVDQARSLIADIPPGESAELKIIRDAKERDLRVAVGKQPENVRSVDSEPIPGRRVPSLGIVARSYRASLPFSLAGAGLRSLAMAARAHEDRRGVLVVEAVTETERGAGDEELRPGELIVECAGRAVASVADLNAALSAAQSDAGGKSNGRKAIALRALAPDGEERTVSIKPR